MGAGLTGFCLGTPLFLFFPLVLGVRMDAGEMIARVPGKVSAGGGGKVSAAGAGEMNAGGVGEMSAGGAGELSAGDASEMSTGGDGIVVVYAFAAQLVFMK